MKGLFQAALSILSAISLCAQDAESPSPSAEAVENFAWLGVAAEDLSTRERATLQLARQPGVRVRVVVPGSPASRAGMTDGDILQTVDEQRIFNRDQLRQLIRSLAPGTAVTLKIRRDDEARNMSATLSVRPGPVGGIGPRGIKAPALEAFPGLAELLEQQGIPPGLPGFRFSMIRWDGEVLVLEDGERVMKLWQKNGRLRLRVMDLAGREQYQGDPTGAKELPAGVAEKLEILLGEWKRRLAGGGEAADSGDR